MGKWAINVYFTSLFIILFGLYILSAGGCLVTTVSDSIDLNINVGLFDSWSGVSRTVLQNIVCEHALTIGFIIEHATF